MPQLSDSEFERALDHYYLRSVRSAVEETYWSSAWRPAAEVRPVLAAALERRGIDPDAEAVQRGADVISRGRRPYCGRAGASASQAERGVTSQLGHRPGLWLGLWVRSSG